MRLPLLAITSASVLLTPLATSAVTLEKLWETPATLHVPEGVHLDHDREVLYVSNIEGKEPWAKDGAGSLARVSLDGEVKESRWISGLHAPKGLGRDGDRLYVADVDQIVVVDLSEGRIAKRIAVPDAQRLNDVSVGPDGTVYVTDSETGKVHQVRDGKVSVFSTAFRNPNGVLATDDSVFVLDHEALYQVNEDGSAQKLVEGLAGHVDGIEQDGDAFIVTTWEGRIYRADPKNGATLLLDTRPQEANAADPAFDHQKRILYVPTFWRNTVVAYQLK